jgi:hypothetical protein
MPLAKIHVLEGQYDEARLGKVPHAVQHGRGLAQRANVQLETAV